MRQHDVGVGRAVEIADRALDCVRHLAADWLDIELILLAALAYDLKFHHNVDVRLSWN